MSVGAGPQMSNFPNGFSQGALVRGVPINPITPGKVFWVYNGTALSPQGRAGSDSNDGTFNSPFATIQHAVSMCVANRGDVIYVKPGHAETIAAAGGLNLNVSGVSVIGLGIGNDRPTISYSTSTAASITVTAAQCLLDNFYIDATGIDALANAISVSAADFYLVNSTMRTATATGQATLGLISTAAADRLTIDTCHFFGSTDAGTTAALQIVGGNQVKIVNNIFYGAYSSGVGAINNITTAMVNAVIVGNNINNLTALSTKAMVFVAGSTGMISGNNMQILSGTAPITGAAMSWVGGNYYAATIATAGTLI